MPSNNSINTSHNPYYGWSQSGGAQQGGSTPSVFGALPYPNPPGASSSRTPHLSAFYLSSFNPTVLNCIAIGSRSQLYYTVSTDNSMPGYTVFKTGDGKNVALVEWQNHPRVEIRGSVGKMDTKDWLRVSRDQTYRIMTIGSIQYTWTPEGQYINLCSRGPTPQFYGRISRGDKTVVIELTADALQIGLLDCVVVAAVLLQCGHNID